METMDFAEAERAYYELKGRLDTGKITPQEFQDRLRDLTVRASDGRMWMIGGQTGRWYYFDGKNWVQAEPPRTQVAGRPAGCVRCGAPVNPGQTLCERCDRNLGAPISVPPAPPPVAVRAAQGAAATGSAGRRRLVAAAATLVVLVLCVGSVVAAVLWPGSPLQGLLPAQAITPPLTWTVPAPTAPLVITTSPTVTSPTAAAVATATSVATAAPTAYAIPTSPPTSTPPRPAPTVTPTATAAPPTRTPVPASTPTTPPAPVVSGRIAYTVFDPATGADNIYVVNADGMGAQQIVSGGMAPSWAPDGRLAYHSVRNDQLGLVIRYPDGSTKYPKQYEVFHEDGMPSWSPDANRLTFAFGSNTQADKPWRIVVMNADGTGRHDLAGFNGRNPAWGAGNLVAFRRFYSQEGLYVVSPEGGAPRLLANVGNDTAPSWSPDGGRVAFMADKDSKGDWDIYVINADGSGLTNLTKSPGVMDLLPAWLPGGKYLAYRSNSGGVWGLWVMGADGTGATRIVQAELDTNRFMEDSMSAQ